ncbi:phage portal protein [Desulfobaculum senezii]
MSLLDIFRGRAVEADPAPRRRTLPPRFGRRNYGAESGSFDAASANRTTAGWTSEPMSASVLVERSWRVLCARGREAANNIDHGKRFLRLVRTNVVGPRGVAVVPTVQLADGSPDALARQALSDAWKHWGQNPEVTGTLTWRELQGLSVQTVARDGEVFVRRLRGRRFGAYHYQLQLIDPVRVPVQMREKLTNGNRIRAGIEFTPEGRPVAYYLRGDQDDYISGVDYGGARYERIPAEEIYHLFVPEMINQPRGVSWMGTALTRMHHLSRYETAAVINARIGASKMGFFESDPEMEVPEFDDDEDEEVFPMDAEPGTMERLPYGYKFRAWDPQYPQGEFGVFVRSCLQSISAGLGVSYASLSGDLSGVNYSSIRAGVLDERDQWMDLQQWFIDKLVQPVFEDWIATAVLAGAIKIGLTPLRAERVEQYKRARYQARRWQWVDPQKDVKAAREAQNGLMRSVSDTIREQGRDPEEVFEEIKEDRDRWEELGLAPAPVKQTAPKGQEHGGDDAEDEADA